MGHAFRHVSRPSRYTPLLHRDMPRKYPVPSVMGINFEDFVMARKALIFDL